MPVQQHTERVAEYQEHVRLRTLHLPKRQLLLEHREVELPRLRLDECHRQLLAERQLFELGVPHVQWERPPGVTPEQLPLTREQWSWALEPEKLPVGL